MTKPLILRNGEKNTPGATATQAVNAGRLRVGGIGMSSRTHDLGRKRVARRVAGTLFHDRSLLTRNLELVLSETQ